jgi:hypothetical protein
MTGGARSGILGGGSGGSGAFIDGLDWMILTSMLRGFSGGGTRERQDSTAISSRRWTSTAMVNA